MNIITMKEKLNEKKAKFTDKAVEDLKRFGAFVERNRDFIVTFVPVAIAGATTITKVIVKRRNLHEERTLKDLYCYDRSLGHYWRLRRELTNREWLEIDQRKASGERMADILADLRVLK